MAKKCTRVGKFATEFSGQYTEVCKVATDCRPAWFPKQVIEVLLVGTVVARAIAQVATVPSVPGGKRFSDIAKPKPS